MRQEPHVITPENAPKIADWIRTRNGIAVWRSIDMSDPTFSLTTPVLQADGQMFLKPHWKMEDKPSRIITDPAEVVVSKDVEVKRFKVGVEQGYGMQVVVSDGGTRHIRKEVEKAGVGAYYTFDYSTQEAVILRPESQTPLTEFMEQYEREKTA